MGRYIVILLLTTPLLKAQNIDGIFIDLIRYSQSNYTSNARSAALGIAYKGILNDNASIVNNPAGLTLSNFSELSVGVNYRDNSNSHSFLLNNNQTKSNNTYLNDFSIAGPIFENLNDSQNLFFGLSYNSFAITDRRINYDTYNSGLSYTGYEIINDRQWTRNLALENDSFILVDDNLYQNYNLNESGRKHNLSLALASQIDESFSIGGSVNISYGFFDYNRVYLEQDRFDFYESEEPDNNQGVDEIRHTLNYSHDYLSASFNLGIMYNVDSTYRFTFNFTTPESMVVDELFIERATLTQDDGRKFSYDNLGVSSSSVFKVSLPWSLDFGASYKLSDLIVAGAVKLKNYNAIDFFEAEDDYFLDLNSNVNSQFKTSFEYGAGIEYNIPYTIFKVRGGYTAITSPVEGSNEITELITAGFSMFIIEAIRLDFFYQNVRFDEQLFLYGTTKLQNENKSETFGLGITYRY